MNRNLLSGLAIGVFAGFLAGYFVGAGHSNEDAPAVVAPAPSQTGPIQPPKVNLQEVQAEIGTLQQALAADPKNEKGWISLGNDFFDTQQPQGAVDAYAKALALHPDNPDVLTDQGIMLRQLKAYDKAIANFKQASRLNPQHLQSLYNLGIVYAEDVHKPDLARKAWDEVIRIAPTSPQADQARAALVGLKPSKP